jgi:hypothetical protein
LNAGAYICRSDFHKCSFIYICTSILDEWREKKFTEQLQSKRNPRHIVVCMDMSSGSLKAPANSAILRRENNIRSRGRPNLKELFIHGAANLICEEAIRRNLKQSVRLYYSPTVSLLSRCMRSLLAG